MPLMPDQQPSPPRAAPAPSAAPPDAAAPAAAANAGPAGRSGAKPGRPRDAARGVHSMTGYAHATHETAAGRVALELRSVNSRFTDLQIRLTDELRETEPMLREAITRSVSRGKIECRGSLRGRVGEAQAPAIDDAAVATLSRLARQIQAIAPDAAPLSVADYLRLAANSPRPEGGDGADRGDADGAASNGEALADAIRPVFEQVLRDFLASRAREGERLADTIRQQIDEMATLTAAIRPGVPELLAQAQARLTERLQAAMADVQSAVPGEETFARIRQEVAMLGLRGDVTEELDRLGIHFAAVREALDQGSPIGKRLDFLTQEMNRESNTIASKASGIAITDAAVALKLLIEQMREQVQNIE